MDDVNAISKVLLELLLKKEQNLLNMLKFTQMQAEVINEKKFEDLQNYINEKQKIIEAVDSIDEQFYDKFKLLKTRLGVNSLEEITNFAGIESLRDVKITIERIHKLIEQILLVEKENSSKVKTQHDDIKNKIQEINSGKKLVSAYEPRPISRGGAFFDKKK